MKLINAKFNYPYPHMLRQPSGLIIKSNDSRSKVLLHLYRNQFMGFRKILHSFKVYDHNNLHSKVLKIMNNI
jgi:hypothetical protein